MLDLLRLVVLREEGRGIFMDHSGLIMDCGSMLMGGNMPLLMPGSLGVTLTHNS